MDDERLLTKHLLNLYMFDQNSFVKVALNLICPRTKALNQRKNKGQMPLPSFS